MFIRDNDRSSNFFVVIVTRKNYADFHSYNGSSYNPFTYDVEKFLLSKIGDKLKTTNGIEYNRLSNEKVGGMAALVFAGGNETHTVIEKQKYIYVLGTNADDKSLYSRIPSTFKFTE